MATYLQGVTDYIPDYQPFQPNLNFYANLLQAKQTQYDTNYKAINNLYAQLYNADLTREDNIEKKDNLLKQIDFNLKRVSGLDLSLQQNVDQATQVFRPFYEDKYLMKDMAWTKNFNNTYNSAVGLKNSSDEKQSKKYWDVGVKELQYRREEFKDATADEALNMASPTYTPYDNALEKYLKIAKDMNLSVDITKPDPSGLYFIRQKNGELILPTLQKLFMSTYATDPNLQKVYQTQAYVNRKDYIFQNADEKFNGDKLAAEKDYLKKEYDFLSNYAAEAYKKNAEESEVTQNKITTVQNAVKEGNVNFKQKSYFEMLDQAFKINSIAEEDSKKVNDAVNGTTSSTVATTNGQTPVFDLNNIELARMKIDAARANVLAQQDIMAAADVYAYKDYVTDIKVNTVGLEGLKHSNSVARLNLTHAQKMQQIEYKDKLQAQADAKKALVESGQYYYDSFVDPVTQEVIIGPLKLNEQWNNQNTTPGTSGQAGPEVIIDQNNRDATREAEDKLTGGYIDNWFTKMANLVDENGGNITEEEAWTILNGGSRNIARAGKTVQGDYVTSRVPLSAEEAKRQQGTEGVLTQGAGNQFYKETKEKRKNGIEQFQEYYAIWKNDKTKGRKLIQAKMNGVLDGMDDWMKKNSGHPMADGYYDQNYASAKQWQAQCQSYEDIEIANNAKIKEALITAGKDIPNIDKIADLYIRTLTGGETDAVYLSSEENFQRLLDANGLSVYEAEQKQKEEKRKTRKLIGSPLSMEDWTVGALNQLYPDEEKELDKRLKAAEGFNPYDGYGTKDREYNVNEGVAYGIRKAYLEEVFGLEPEKDWTSPVESKEEKSLASTKIVYDLLSKTYLDVATSTDPNIGLISVVPITTNAQGKAALFADKSFYNVNPSIPNSIGAKSFSETFNDIMRINWNQDPTQYKVSDEGSTISARNMGSDLAKSLLSELYNGFKPGSTVLPFRLEQSQVAMENRKLGAMTIYPTMEFLKEKVKSVYDPVTEQYTSDADLVNQQIQKLYNNGITFTAPRTEWTNSLFTGNIPTPTEQIINAKGKIEYNDINNAGSFTIEKVDAAGADYRIAYRLRSLQPDGSALDIPMDPMNMKRGNNIDMAYQNIFATISQMNQSNLEMYRTFHKQNNVEAMKNAELNFGFTPSRAGFNF